jgi:hypothetical protein
VRIADTSPIAHRDGDARPTHYRAHRHDCANSITNGSDYGCINSSNKFYAHERNYAFN